MIPYVRNKVSDNLKIKDFSGGVNYVMSKTLINDNQLTDVDNMWFKDGALRTRPNLKRLNNENNVYQNVQDVSVNEMNSVVINNKRYFLETVKEELSANTKINMRLVSNSDAIDIGSVVLDGTDISYFAVIFKEDIYLFSSGNNKIFVVERTGESQYKPPRKVEDFEIYSPLVLTNCWSCYNDSGKINAMLARGATQFENFNILSNRYRIEYSQYDTKNYIEAEEGNALSRVSYMEYGLPYTTNTCEGSIVLDYVDSAGAVHRHMVDCPKENAPTVETQAEMEIAGDDLYMHAFIKGNVCHVTLNSSGDVKKVSPDYISIENYVNNNLVIDAPRPNKNWEKVTLMTQAVWYGNNALGINGGSRLFLGGNKKEKSLLVWSDFESPLYFPESNYAYVGDKGQKITALAKQGSSLIIFKEKEIYSTQYNVGETEASKKDITLGNAYFPMTLIHPAIGCICAKSVQLLRNRLVFMASSGNICTLTEQNQYSESNVYTVSEMVAPKMKSFDDAISVDWGGFYLLFCKNEVFVMDYNTYGYVNIRSTDKESTANMRIPWFVWHLPQEITAVVNNDEQLSLWVKTQHAGTCFVDVMTFSDEESEDTYFEIAVEPSQLKKEEKLAPVNYLVETRHFDFDVPYRLKVLEKVYVDGVKSHNLAVSFITDEEFSDVQTGFFNCLVPQRRVVKTLGLRLQGQGRFVLYALNVRFRYGELIR